LALRTVQANENLEDFKQPMLSIFLKKSHSLSRSPELGMNFLDIFYRGSLRCQ